MRMWDPDTMEMYDARDDYETEVTMENLLFWLDDRDAIVISCESVLGFAPAWELTFVYEGDDYYSYDNLDDLLVDINNGVY